MALSSGWRNVERLTSKTEDTTTYLGRKFSPMNEQH
jgi:hypothetical protein